jgi:hypothetical protein
MINEIFKEYGERVPDDKSYNEMWIKIDKNKDGNLSDEEFMDFIYEIMEENNRIREEKEALY